MKFPSEQKSSLLVKVNIAIASVAALVIATAAIAVFVIGRNNAKETEYLQSNLSSILSDRYRNGPTPDSSDKLWPDLIYKNHPTATHIASVKIHPAFPYLKYVGFALKDDNGWHNYQFQVDHYKLFTQTSLDTPSPITDSEMIKQFEEKKMALLE